MVLKYEIKNDHQVDDFPTLLEDYFQLKTHTLDSLFAEWSMSKPQKCDKKDINQAFNNLCSTYKGLRLMRQDPFECLISFICSQNNNIKRISSMIDQLCIEYGSLLCEIDGVKYYSFPTLDSLCLASESRLRELKFGYRSKYIVKAANEIKEFGGVEWLNSLRSCPLFEVQTELVKLTGIGPKVADCIALYSLDKYDAIPVDTHIWRVSKDFMTINKKLDKSMHLEIGEYWRRKFGKNAGWAQLVFFASQI